MSIQAQLILWARARAVNDPPNGYPTQTPFAREMGEGNVSLPSLSDDVHNRVDAAVGRLRAVNPDRHKVILMSYRERMTDYRIAERLRIPRTTVLSRRLAAEYWLDGEVNAIDNPDDFVAGV